MRRRQLFEVHDQAWVPSPIRESVVEILGTTLRWGGIARALVPILNGFFVRTSVNEVLELCSGSGATVQTLLTERKATEPTSADTAARPRFVLTDLCPAVPEWAELCKEFPGEIRYVPHSVDATAIEPDAGCQQSWLILNAFHHFPPELARAILAAADRSSHGILIAENFGRNPLATLACGVVAVPAALATPWLTRRRRLAKAFWTYVVPIIPLAVAWDGVVSALRMYEPDELMEMTRRLNRLEWAYQSFSYAYFGRGYVFTGVPRRG